MFVSPELACGANAGLNFVNNKKDIMASGDLTEAFEESWGGVVVAAFGLDGFYHHGSDWVVEVLD